MKMSLLISSPLASWAGFLTLLLCGSAFVPDANAQNRRTGTTGNSNRQYYNNTMLGDAIVEIDEETRSLIIITDEETNVEIEKVITSLDQPKPQVLIKVVFLEVTHGDESDIGVEGWININNKDTVITPGMGFGVDSLASMANPAAGGFVRIVDDNFQLTMRAIAENGKFEVLARPSILARNNQEAVIMIGEQVPFIQNTRITDTGQTVNTITYEDLGIILRVTPFITSDGLVEMIVAPEISTTTDETVTVSDGVEAPVYAKRIAETVIVAADGQTAVIGGLIESKKTEAVRKVPLLGDIPGLGSLFRRTIKENVKTELLIFLTPEIINDPRDLYPLTRNEVEGLELTPKVYSPEQIDRFLGKDPNAPKKADYDMLQDAYDQLGETQ